MGRTSSCGLWPLRAPGGSAPPSARCFGQHRLGALSAAVERRRPLRHARHLTRPRYPTGERPDRPCLQTSSAVPGDGRHGASLRAESLVRAREPDPVRSRRLTALSQVERLGFSPRDVCHGFSPQPGPFQPSCCRQRLGPWLPISSTWARDAPIASAGAPLPSAVSWWRPAGTIAAVRRTRTVTGKQRELRSRFVAPVALRPAGARRPHGAACARALNRAPRSGQSLSRLRGPERGKGRRRPLRENA